MFYFLIFIFINQIFSLDITWAEYLKRFPRININSNSLFHFRENIKWIINQNSMNHSYKLGLTPFLHLSEIEWKSRFNNISNFVYEKFEIVTKHNSNLSEIPNFWSWYDKNLTTLVKDQSNCGSCYSFSATETIETTWAIKSKNLFVLSPQQIVDCSKLNQGCNGGLQSRAYKYLQNTGQCLDSDYLYTAKDGTCYNCKAAVPLLSTYVSVNKDEVEMTSALLVTSLAVAIEADQKQFQTYSSGILDFECGTNLNHAVTIEGMGTENGKDYWLVRNSWGPDWGDKGYVKMVRGKNLCGIKESVFYPVF